MTTHEVVTLSPRMSLAALHPVAALTHSLPPCPVEGVPATRAVESPSCSPRRGPLPGLLSPGVSSLRQEGMVSRLQQLMAWQERQKASLLRQQQEEIMRLHRLQQASYQAEQEHGKVLNS